MLDRIMTHDQLLTLVDELVLSRRVVGPVQRDGRDFYEAVERAAALDLTFNYCVYSPKAMLFPAHETLFKFQRSNGSFQTEAVHDESPLALIGVHPCDVNAIRVLDRVFEHDNRDEHYLRRRQATFILGVDCPAPCTEGVFCRDMKTHNADQGFDLMCYPLSKDKAGTEIRYGVVFGTAAGRELVLYKQAGHSPTVQDERSFESYQNHKQDAFPQMIPYDADSLPQLLERSYDSLLWEATARRCYSCGSCNLTCPTCYCFNTYDEVDMTRSSGERQREWDGCQLRGFALVAGDHNFRGRAAARLRHRIYRKASWIKEREGISGCVGCRRCDRACTAKINSVEIYNQLAEEG